MAAVAGIGSANTAPIRIAQEAREELVKLQTTINRTAISCIQNGIFAKVWHGLSRRPLAMPVTSRSGRDVHARTNPRSRDPFDAGHEPPRRRGRRPVRHPAILACVGGRSPGLPDVLNSIRAKVTATALAVIVVATVINAVVGGAMFTDVYASALQSRAVAIGRSLGVQLQRMLTLDIQARQIAGIDQQLRDAIDAHEGVAGIAVVGADGETVFWVDHGTPIPRPDVVDITRALESRTPVPAQPGASPWQLLPCHRSSRRQRRLQGDRRQHSSPDDRRRTGRARHVLARLRPGRRCGGDSAPVVDGRDPDRQAARPAAVGDPHRGRGRRGGRVPGPGDVFRRGRCHRPGLQRDARRRCRRAGGAAREVGGAGAPAAGTAGVPWPGAAIPGSRGFPGAAGAPGRGAVGSRPGPGGSARRGGSGEPGKDAIPGDDEPRDPYADERCAGHDRPAAGRHLDRRPAPPRPDGARIGRHAAHGDQRHSRLFQARGRQRRAGSGGLRPRPGHRGRLRS